jgi:hypothetical protein
MVQSTRLSPTAPFYQSPPVQPSAEESNLALRGALHDLNNLLLIIATNTSLALNQLPADSAARKHMKQAGEAANQAALLSQQLHAAHRK